MTDEKTIGELNPITTLLPAALIEIEQTGTTFSATIAQVKALAWGVDQSTGGFKLTSPGATDVIINAPVGQALSIEIAGTEEFRFSSSGLDMKEKFITECTIKLAGFGDPLPSGGFFDGPNSFCIRSMGSNGTTEFGIVICDNSDFFAFIGPLKFNQQIWAQHPEVFVSDANADQLLIRDASAGTSGLISKIDINNLLPTRIGIQTATLNMGGNILDNFTSLRSNDALVASFGDIRLGDSAVIAAGVDSIVELFFPTNSAADVDFGMGYDGADVGIGNNVTFVIYSSRGVF